MKITKLNASDGAAIWDMTLATTIGNGAESVAFLSDGSFVVGGYKDGKGQGSFKSMG